MKARHVPFILLLALIVGCISSQTTLLSEKTYPAVLPEEVVIYLTEADIPGKFEKLAIINTQGSSTMTNESMMYKKAREQAASLGANGLLVPPDAIDEPSTAAEIVGTVLGTGTTRRGEMIAIRVLDEKS